MELCLFKEKKELKRRDLKKGASREFDKNNRLFKFFDRGILKKEINFFNFLILI